MDKVSGRLTVFFEEPFWIGVFEHIGEEILDALATADELARLAGQQEEA